MLVSSFLSNVEFWSVSTFSNICWNEVRLNGFDTGPSWPAVLELKIFETSLVLMSLKTDVDDLLPDTLPIFFLQIFALKRGQKIL